LNVECPGQAGDGQQQDEHWNHQLAGVHGVFSFAVAA
jgi:hypothetical protein